MLALAGDTMRRPDVGMLALGLFGVIAVLIGVMIFRFIYFDRSGSRPEVAEDLAEPGQGSRNWWQPERVGGRQCFLALQVGVTVDHRGGQPQPERILGLAERAGGQRSHAVLPDQVPGEVCAAVDAAAAEPAAPRLE